MNKHDSCPKCGYCPANDMCQVRGCESPAEYEAWYRVRDFTNNTTGTIQRIQVCKEHISVTIAGGG